LKNPLTRLENKQMRVITIVGIVVVIILVGYGTQLFINSRYDQGAVDKLYAKGCNDNTISTLKVAYSKAKRNSTQKALRAEQIGNCYALASNYSDAETWFRKAETDYKKNKNNSRSEQMKTIADNYKALGQIPKSVVPSGTTDEQKKQGIGSN